MESLIIPFNPKKAAFGRHETFALRYSWLTKGFQAFTKNPDIFSSDAATVELGVGKNMVNAIKYWLLATKMLKRVDNGYQTTAIGEAIFSENGFDPYLEDEATLWLIHWLLVTNSESATAWYWFFNHYHKAEFNSDEAGFALADFVKNKLAGKHSERTVKQEVVLILRMYAQSRSQSKTALDDLLDSPLASLKLINYIPATKNYQSLPVERPQLAVDIIGFAVNEILNQHQVNQLPIEELMYRHQQSVALGAVFRLTETALLAKLELLVAKYPNDYRIDEIAGIHQFSRLNKNIEPLQLLKNHYTDKEQVTV
ncbi:conserved hypothetical protein [Bathymodiolus platifrons methanotrophic gill symbiont]|uniref:DUF4007 family protein n=2 Tax=unclassified Gammaproteobacteria TaxID=33811 RepID=UPI000B416D1A|nr:DUF4007 family protein [Bathymodiolus platifrons methanotrophic gill symbiont]TXK95688.1 DUF4007 domain-containing protein [Methylococcaceae bacterium CS4]TXK96823.1 DUF4007 domain-containing protein [Methylococcaceae bacterium CS5]TXL02853.1 DUF4007 domain-containing protein [Methylococcaceae bacterium CS1]TXL03121.1 DUF4007 domain-containing protein [Methylococcaceae bacterium CS3]TXL04275.1 DUF4007 domain-containing protein [Methylococcaceae bacterium CS2]